MPAGNLQFNRTSAYIKKSVFISVNRTSHTAGSARNRFVERPNRRLAVVRMARVVFQFEIQPLMRLGGNWSQEAAARAILFRQNGVRTALGRPHARSFPNDVSRFSTPSWSAVTLGLSKKSCAANLRPGLSATQQGAPHSLARGALCRYRTRHADWRGTGESPQFRCLPLMLAASVRWSKITMASD
jgi:hypothetical protein